MRFAEDLARLGITTLAGLLLSGCWPTVPGGPGGSRTFRDGSSAAIILQAEKKATPVGARVLAQAREMTVDRHEILPGSCWDYVDAVYKRAGYPGGKRRTVFKSGTSGPYATAADIQAGDWLYFINHSYNDIEHSSMFVAWADREALQGWLLSYAGERRAEPPSYKLYRLDSTYQIVRPQG